MSVWLARWLISDGEYSGGPDNFGVASPDCVGSVGCGDCGDDCGDEKGNAGWRAGTAMLETVLGNDAD